MHATVAQGQCNAGAPKGVEPTGRPHQRVGLVSIPQDRLDREGADVLTSRILEWRLTVADEPPDNGIESILHEQVTSRRLHRAHFDDKADVIDDVAGGSKARRHLHDPDIAPKPGEQLVGVDVMPRSAEPLTELVQRHRFVAEEITRNDREVLVTDHDAQCTRATLDGDRVADIWMCHRCLQSSGRCNLETACDSQDHSPGRPQRPTPLVASDVLPLPLHPASWEDDMPIDERLRLDIRQWFTEHMNPDMADAIMEAMPPIDFTDLATRRDLEGSQTLMRGEMSDLTTQLRGEMSDLRHELRADMADLRTELHTDMTELRHELRTDMADLRTELHGDMADLRVELRGEMADLRSELCGEMAELRGEMSELRHDVCNQIKDFGRDVDVRLEQGFNRQLKWLVASQFAAVGVLGAVMGLIAAVS